MNNVKSKKIINMRNVAVASSVIAIAITIYGIERLFNYTGDSDSLSFVWISFYFFNALVALVGLRCCAYFYWKNTGIVGILLAVLGFLLNALIILINAVLFLGLYFLKTVGSHWGYWH